MSLIHDAGEFLSNDFNRFLTLTLLVVALTMILFVPEPSDVYRVNKQEISQRNASLEIYFFEQKGCIHCKEQRPFNALMEEKYPQIKFLDYDIHDSKNLELFKYYYAQHNLDFSKSGTPATFVGNYSIIGFHPQDIEDAINATLTHTQLEKKEEPTLSTLKLEIPFIGTIKPGEYSLLLLAVMLGLVDGFNPCAMWVLVYLISIVMVLKDKSRLWLIVGTFVAASGILYFLFMTAWLEAFLFIGYFRPVMIVVGCIAVGAGLLSLKEFAQNPSGTLECKVVDSKSRKKTMKSIDTLIHAPMTWATLAGIIVLAFTVNSIEFMCSFGIPAVFSQVLALSDLSAWHHYFYIFIYVLFFMLDDLLIFGLAAMAVSSNIGQKYAGYCHVFGGFVMLLLGLVLLFFPQVL
jgi:hypothetical protein